MPALRFLDLELQTVTPLLSGGAFYQAELRPPSFRGVMRYWLRALLGGVLGQEPVLVRQVEGALFGTTHRASLIAVRATGEPATAGLPVTADEFPGAGYLLYAAYQSRRNAILPEERFHLRLQTRPLAPPALTIKGQPFDQALAWRLAAASLWLAVHLGGAGFRMRRGAGNMRFAAETGDWPAELPPLITQAATPQALAEEYASHLTQLRQALGWTPVSSVPAIPTFNLLHPGACQLYVVDQSYPTWHQALDGVGQALRSFRDREPEDYEAVKGFLTGPRPARMSVKRVVFGLPLMFFFSSLYRELTDQGVPSQEARARSSCMVVPSRGGARPSPLWFKVARLAGEPAAYAVQLMLLRSQFLPDNMLSLRARDRSIPSVDFRGPSDFSFIEEWFDHVAGNVGPLLPVQFA